MSEAFARPDVPLCAVLLHYEAPLVEMDAAMHDHVAWLTKGYEAGVFLASGRKVPRTGGVILVRGERDAVEAVVATDPFVSRGLATATIVPFTASMASHDFAALLA